MVMYVMVGMVTVMVYILLAHTTLIVGMPTKYGKIYGHAHSGIIAGGIILTFVQIILIKETGTAFNIL